MNNNCFKKIKGEIYIIDPKENFIILQILDVPMTLKNMLSYEKVLRSTLKLLKSKNNY